MIGAGSAIFVPYLPRETYDQVYENGPGMIITASAQPAGTAEAVPWWLADQRTVAVRERLPARGLDTRIPRCDRRREAITRTGRGGRPANASGLHVAGARVADRGHLVRRRAQGYREPSCHAQGHVGPGGELLRSGERRTMSAGAALSSRAAAYSAVPLRLRRRYSRGRARCTRRMRQHRAAAAAGRRADAGFRNIPIRTRPHRS
jgi:hypothetical protein